MSNITNLNRDYLIKINVKEATIDVPKMTFWNTDKKTSNMFVQLVINMSTNELISQYVTVQNATDYKITLNVIKPKTNQYRTIEATLLNEEKALFEIDLPDEFTDQVGDYSFEFEVSSKVDSNDESITTSNGTYKVNGSILTNLNQEISSSPDLPILKQLIEQVKSLQGGDLTGYQKKSDAAQKTIVEDGKLYLTKLDGTKLDDGTTLPTGSGTSIDDTNTTTDKTWSSSKIDSQFKDIANNQPTDLSLDSATNLLQLVNSKGSKLGNGITFPMSSGGGTSQYLHIKYSSTGAPQLAGQISDTPNAYIGLCVDTNADSPTNPKNYTWYNWKGDNGDTGATPNLQIGTVTTLESGSNATASITGTTENPLLNLGIPKGAKGDKGDTGASIGGTIDTLVTTNISGTTLSLTTDKYQTATVVDGTEITLPAVTSFREIHLFFNTTTDLTLILPSCKWQNGNTPTISANKTYEFIFTYTTEWLGGVIEYE